MAATLALPLLAQEKPRTAGPVEGGFLLPNGWTITPAGEQVSLPDLPLNILPLADGKHALVASSGYNDHDLSLIDLADEGRRRQAERPPELVRPGARPGDRPPLVGRRRERDAPHLLPGGSRTEAHRGRRSRHRGDDQGAAGRSRQTQGLPGRGHVRPGDEDPLLARRRGRHRHRHRHHRPGRRPDRHDRRAALRRGRRPQRLAALRLRLGRPRRARARPGRPPRRRAGSPSASTPTRSPSTRRTTACSSPAPRATASPSSTRPGAPSPRRSPPASSRGPPRAARPTPWPSAPTARRSTSPTPTTTASRSSTSPSRPGARSRASSRPAGIRRPSPSRPTARACSSASARGTRPSPTRSTPTTKKARSQGNDERPPRPSGRRPSIPVHRHHPLGALSIVPVPDEKQLADYTAQVYRNCPYSDKLLTAAPLRRQDGDPDQGRRPVADQVRHLHHQGEPHLRPGVRRHRRRATATRRW